MAALISFTIEQVFYIWELTGIEIEELDLFVLVATYCQRH